MPNVFCNTCGGDGLVRVLCEHAEHKKIFSHIISCPECNGHSETQLLKKQGETWISPDMVPSLLEIGYTYA